MEISHHQLSDKFHKWNLLLDIAVTYSKQHTVLYQNTLCSTYTTFYFWITQTWTNINNLWYTESWRWLMSVVMNLSIKPHRMSMSATVVFVCLQHGPMSGSSLYPVLNQQHYALVKVTSNNPLKWSNFMSFFVPAMRDLSVIINNKMTVSQHIWTTASKVQATASLIFKCFHSRDWGTLLKGFIS